MFKTKHNMYRASHVLVDLGWVDFDFCVQFHHLAQLPSRLCQIPISPSRVGQTVEHSKSNSTKPSLRAHGMPCISNCQCDYWTELNLLPPFLEHLPVLPVHVGASQVRRGHRIPVPHARHRLRHVARLHALDSRIRRLLPNLAEGEL